MILDLEPNEVPFGSKSKGKLSPRPYLIQYERKWNTSFLSVGAFRPELVFRYKNIVAAFLNEK